MRLLKILLVIGVLSSAACHPGPVIGSDSSMAATGGTIAGIVSTSTNAPVVGRKVTAVNVASGTRIDATTGANGGYTMKVPQGTYRLELELRQGESITKHPGETKINRSDLDAQRNFVITGG